MSQTDAITETAGEQHVAPSARPINVIVEVNGRNQHLQFEGSRVTGRQIREAAGVPLTDDLTHLIHGKPSGGNIGLDDLIDIQNGDHFIALPTGTVS